jgi:predicted NAD/FAD-dependent oxidoreductase
MRHLVPFSLSPDRVAELSLILFTSWRLCVDYRFLNQVTVQQNWPMNRILEILDRLFGSKFFSSGDLRSGYYQILLDDESIPKTTFSTQDGHPRYIGTHGMNGIAKHLAQGLDIHCNTFVFEVTRNEDTTWSIKIDDGKVFQSDALVVTCPLPQAYSLLITAHVDIPEALFKCEYDRTIGLLVVLDSESAVPSPGGMQNPSESLQFVADNYMKGISHIPALTLHFSPAFSERHWDDDPHALHQLLVHHAQPFLRNSLIVESQVKKWRFATPRTPWQERIWQHESLVIAGDAMSGPKVEGAALSGLAAASAISELQN